MQRPVAVPRWCKSVTITATSFLVGLASGSASGSPGFQETRSPVGPSLIAAKTEIVGAEVERAKIAAVTALAERLGMSAAQIEVESITEQTWPDTSLGCAEEGRMYLQVITPGYTLQLRVKARRYEYHVDQSAKIVLSCPTPEKE